MVDWNPLEPRFGSSGSADAVRGVALDGACVDSLHAPGDPTSPAALAGAEERPGIHEVHIEAAGYAPWDTADVEVDHDGCHVETAFLTARLVPGRAGAPADAMLVSWRLRR